MLSFWTNLVFYFLYIFYALVKIYRKLLNPFKLITYIVIHFCHSLIYITYCAFESVHFLLFSMKHEGKEKYEQTQSFWGDSSYHQAILSWSSRLWIKRCVVFLILFYFMKWSRIELRLLSWKETCYALLNSFSKFYNFICYLNLL